MDKLFGRIKSFVLVSESVWIQSSYILYYKLTFFVTFHLRRTGWIKSRIFFLTWTKQFSIQFKTEFLEVCIRAEHIFFHQQDSQTQIKITKSPFTEPDKYTLKFDK